MLAQREKILALIAGSLVGLLILINFIVSPYVHSWQQTSRRIADARRQLGEAEGISQRKEEVLRRWQAVTAKVQVSSVGDREAAFLSFLKLEARSCGFSFPREAPKRRSNKDDIEYTESVFDMKFKSPLAGPVQFLANLHRAEELSRIIGLAISSAPGDTGRTLDVNLMLSTVALPQKSSQVKKSGNPTSTAISYTPATGKADLGTYEVIIERNIFSPYPPRTEPVRVVVDRKPETPLPPSTPPMVLTGVLRLHQGWVAIVEDESTSDKKVLSVGNEVSGWTIDEIGLTGIDISRAGERREVKVGRTLSGEQAQFSTESPGPFSLPTKRSEESRKPMSREDRMKLIEKLRARRATE